jgi:uncharacterized OB-fold protein
VNAPYRPRPRLTALTAPYWTSGRDGVLHIQRCDACGYFVHPPGPVCPRCHGRALTFTPMCGRATVMAATVNHQPWYPGWPGTYVVAIVELDEQPGLRLTTNLVGDVPPDPIGARVQVEFVEHDGIWLPLFAPVHTEAGP